MEDTARGIRALTSQLDGLTAAEDLDGVGKAGQQAYKDILRRVMTVIEEDIRHKLTGTRGNTPATNTAPKPTTAQKRAPQTWVEKAAAGKTTQAAKPKGTATKAQANAPPALPENPKTSHRKVDENRLLATLFEDSNWKMVNPAVVKQRINTNEEGKLVTRPTSMEDVKPDIQMAFGGDIKLMDWREYEHDPSMRGPRVAIHEPKKVPKAIEILGLFRMVRQSLAKARATPHKVPKMRTSSPHEQLDQTRQPRKAASPHPPEPPIQMASLRPQKEPPNEKENSPPGPRFG
ncbi:hypothetical protein CFIMG_005153RAa [Ceratocystis fimbriata CBS 114723]|uniref:Uncharacterized protein n=1 Tax=Ceratocystis fimbriata CBS 114723 TaxID=1035309 RepID=A0A2C5X3K4_9PEZI|nr:hypothetical protein CFIMG_005153RAa [Ceratocystis fimbriata CBS 114723]